jgi:hypothetical protein
MGVVAIKPDHIREIQKLLSVLDNSGRDTEIIYFTTKNAVSGGVDVLIIDDKTNDMNELLVELTIPYHSLEGELETTLTVKDFKEVSHQLVSTKSTKPLFIECTKGKYTNLWVEGGENRIIEDVTSNPEVHYTLLDAKETLLDPVVGEPVYCCEITPKEARTMEQCALLATKSGWYNPVLSHVLMSYTESTGGRTYGAVDGYRVVRHTCYNTGDVECFEEHGSFVAGLPKSVVRLLKEMTPARKSKTSTGSGKSSIYISMSSNYGLVETSKGNIGFTYTAENSRTLRLGSMPQFVTNPPQQTATRGSAVVDGNSLIDTLEIIKKEAEKKKDLPEAPIVVELSNVEPNTLTIAAFPLVENKALQTFAEHTISITETEPLEIIGTYNLKYLLGGLKTLKETARTKLGEVHILAPEDGGRESLHVFSGVSKNILQANDPKSSNLWNTRDTAANVLIMPVTVMR